MNNMWDMLGLAIQASLGRHTARSLAGSAKQINKQKKKVKDFIVDSLHKGNIKWETLKEK